MKRAFAAAILISAVTGLATACAGDEGGEAPDNEAGAPNQGGTSGTGGNSGAGEHTGGETAGIAAGGSLGGFGGEAGSSVVEGGAAGTPGPGSQGGEAGGGSQDHPPFEYDSTLCDCSLTEEMTAECTLLSTERFLMLADPIYDDCGFADGIPEIEHLECDDGTLRYEWTESEGVLVRIVLDAESGDPVHLYGTGNYACFVKQNGRTDNATVTYGTFNAAATCERTFYCCLDGDCGTAGQGGAPGQSGAGGQGGAAGAQASK